MKFRYPQSWIDELYSKIDMVQLVEDYVPLKQKGQNFWGLCPFHNEKTPSFSVNEQMNVYYCFGCHSGGNAVQFVMDLERLTYPEALEYLAARFNMPLPDNMVQVDEDAASLRDRIYSANEEAAKYYHGLLWSKEGAKVLDYYRKRGLSDSTIRKFGLGASSSNWTALLDYLLDKGFTKEELVGAGLIVQKENNTYDMFRNRAMFPILNLHSKVLGFGGRMLEKGEPKYINSPDSPVFNKCYGVYGANLIRKTRGLERIVLVEGYMDVIALTQAGIKGAVATLGTALTNEQARFLKRFSDEIWISYDGDEAGQNATERAIEIFRKELIRVKVLMFPASLDPDSFIKEEGVDAFLKLNPISEIHFLLLRAKNQFDLSTQGGRLAYAKQAADILSYVDNPLELELYIKQLSLDTGFSEESINAQLKIAGNKIQIEKKTKEKRTFRKSLNHRKGSVAESAEEELLLILSTNLLPEGFVNPEDFLTPVCSKIAEFLISGHKPAAAMHSLEDEKEKSWAAKLFSDMPNYSEESALTAAEECKNVLKRKRLEKNIDKLNEKLKHVQGEERKNYVLELAEMTTQLSKIKSKML
jgi:DNA primase